MPVSSVETNENKMVLGKLCNISIALLLGHPHFYEGYSLSKCVFPVRLLKQLGVTYLILTNHAGGIREDFNAGDIMLIKDHLNLMTFEGHNPLRGSNDDRWGLRFPTVNEAYDEKLKEKAKSVFKDAGLEGTLVEGIYACVGGPNLETIAEANFLKKCGADVVGMSTVHEVIAARHCGLSVLALSLITNKCAMDWASGVENTYAEASHQVAAKEETLKTFLKKLVEVIGQQKSKHVCRCGKPKR